MKNRKGETIADYEVVRDHNFPYEKNFLIKITWKNGKPKIEKFDCDELVKIYKKHK